MQSCESWEQLCAQAASGDRDARKAHATIERYARDGAKATHGVSLHQLKRANPAAAASLLQQCFLDRVQRMRYGGLSRSLQLTQTQTQTTTTTTTTLTATENGEAASLVITQPPTSSSSSAMAIAPYNPSSTTIAPYNPSSTTIAPYNPSTSRAGLLSLHEHQMLAYTPPAETPFLERVQIMLRIVKSQSWLVAACVNQLCECVCRRLMGNEDDFQFFLYLVQHWYDEVARVQNEAQPQNEKLSNTQMRENIKLNRKIIGTCLRPTTVPYRHDGWFNDKHQFNLVAGDLRSSGNVFNVLWFFKNDLLILHQQLLPLILRCDGKSEYTWCKEIAQFAVKQHRGDLDPVFLKVLRQHFENMGYNDLIDDVLAQPEIWRREHVEQLRLDVEGDKIEALDEIATHLDEIAERLESRQFLSDKDRAISNGFRELVEELKTRRRHEAAPRGGRPGQCHQVGSSCSPRHDGVHRHLRPKR